MLLVFSKFFDQRTIDELVEGVSHDDMYYVRDLRH